MSGRTRSRTQRSTRTQRSQRNESPEEDMFADSGEDESQQSNTQETENDLQCMKEFTVNMVKYILQNCGSKLPIKKSEIVKNVLDGRGAVFHEVFSDAKNKLREIYGYEMIEFKGHEYFCISKYPLMSIEAYDYETQATLPLLFLIVSYIFMKGGVVDDITLAEFLASFDIHFDEDHKVFGNVKKLVSETFVKQAYLKRIKTTLESTNEVQMGYDIGERASIEFSKKGILKTVAKLMKKPPEFFAAQYEVAFESDDEEEADFIDDTGVDNSESGNES